jgi:hypothetical protein
MRFRPAFGKITLDSNLRLQAALSLDRTAAKPKNKVQRHARVPGGKK